MIFEVVYHPKVISKDIPRIPKNERKSIQKAIEERLTTKPEVFGEPLRKSLKGYKKLRVGNYRVVYRIESKKVKIFVIEDRSVVYEKFMTRFS